MEVVSLYHVPTKAGAGGPQLLPARSWDNMREVVVGNLTNSRLLLYDHRDYHQSPITGTSEEITSPSTRKILK